MASGKRASMREGPLAALFRKTRGGASGGRGRGAPRSRASARSAPPRAERARRARARGRPARRERRARATRACPTPEERLRTRLLLGHPREHHGARAARRASRPLRQRARAGPPAGSPLTARPGPARGRRGRRRRERGRPDDRGRGRGRRVHRGQHRPAVARELQRADARAHRQRGPPAGSARGRTRSSAARPRIEQYDELKGLLKGADMIFITAGAGGGTGTGAAPVVARIAREVGRAHRRHRDQAVRLRGRPPRRPGRRSASRSWPPRSTRSSRSRTRAC